VLRETKVSQIAATNSAWPLARYPILIFLDSDDLLFPHAATSVARIWLGATLKAQYHTRLSTKRLDGSAL